MNDIQKKKRDFRNSKAWKAFREKKKEEQKGLSGIRQRKLTKHWHLHHKCLDEKKYTDISDPSRFICLNHQEHEVIHVLLNWIKTDKSMVSVERLIQEAKEEAILNGFIGAEGSRGIEEDETKNTTEKD